MRTGKMFKKKIKWLNGICFVITVCVSSSLTPPLPLLLPDWTRYMMKINGFKLIKCSIAFQYFLLPFYRGLCKTIFASYNYKCSCCTMYMACFGYCLATEVHRTIKPQWKRIE